MSPRMPGPRVLLLDDDGASRETLSVALSTRGCHVTQCQALAQALAHLAQSTPDVCVINSELPNGLDKDFVGSLPGGEHRPRIIYCTGDSYSSETVQRLHHDLLADVVLPKPVVPVELVLHVLGLAARPRHSEGRHKIRADALASTSMPGPLDALRAAYLPRLIPQLVDLSQIVGQIAEATRFDLVERYWLTADARKLAHKLCGTAGSYGYGPTSKLCCETEQLLSQASATQAPGEDRQERLCQLSDKLAARAVALQSAPEYPRADALTPTPQDDAILLIVQANAAQAQRLAATARTQGQRTEVACSETQAVAQSLRLQPSITIIDEAMATGEDAYRLIRRLRALPGGSMTRIALVTTGDGASLRLMAARTPVELVYSGPLTPALLVELLRRLEHRRPRQPRIMVIDDDPDFVEVVTAALHARGANTIVLSNASDCLAELDRHEPDLVMLDLMMPIVNGLDLCRLIRSSARWCELPLVAVTAWTDPEVRATAYRAGADDYLAKPLVEEELGARIVKRAQRARQDRDVRERDGLTDLLLRSPFLHRTEQLLAAARRRAASFCLAMVDIDHFKQVNDTHGHLVGDQVLAAVGRILRQGVRTEDFCARWGGEEFAIALVGSSTDQAHEVLHRLLDTVQEFGFNGAQNQIFHVSFSGGIACSEMTPGNASTLIAQADQALYRAKAAGRQRILS